MMAIVGSLIYFMLALINHYISLTRKIKIISMRRKGLVGNWGLLLLISASTFVLCCLRWCDGNKSSKANPAAVTFSQRSFIINGKPRLLFSGSIHYTRVPPSDWDSVFKLAKVMHSTIYAFFFFNN